MKSNITTSVSLLGSGQEYKKNNSFHISKKIFTILFLSLFASTISAQAPQKMSYQAVIRNASNALVANANVGMRISVLQGTATGTVVFSEYFNPTTNANGLVTLEIGTGTILTGSFTGINWANGPYFIKTETDPTGPGTNYTIVGTSQMASVPYALYAAKSGSSVSLSGTANSIVKFGTATTGVDSQISDDGTYVKIKPAGYTGFDESLSAVQIEGNNNTLRLIGTGPDYGEFGKLSFGDVDRVYITEDIDDNMRINSYGRLAVMGGNVGLGTLTPSEKLEVTGKTKTTDLQVTTGAAAGKVLTSDAAGNATWQTAASGWSLTGNSGTTPGTNFIGTTDDKDIVFNRNNTKAGRIGADNISFGDRALNALSTGLYNVAFGRIASFSNTSASYNVAIGASSLFANTGGDANTVVGYNALSAGTSVSKNVAIGTEALKSATVPGQVAVGYMAMTANTSGQGNTAIGFESLKANSTGGTNTAVGSSSLKFNTTGESNTALGYQTLLSNTTGRLNTAIGFNTLASNTDGIVNTAVGSEALYANVSGESNTAIGSGTLRSNVNGDQNVAVGTSALFSSTNAYLNTAIGYRALTATTNGFSNTAVGSGSMEINTGGINNTAIGGGSLPKNTTGIGNTALGYNAIPNNATGTYNIGVGYSSLRSATATNYSIAIGYSALGTQLAGDNNIGIGRDAEVPLNSVGNQIRMGNSLVTYAGIQVGWSITSDKKWKDNIQKSTLGLDFINKLNPVTYTRKNDERKKTEFGFIAQELEQALNASGAKDNGIITVGDDGMYSVRYNDLISISVKAIQEQQEIINSQNDKIKTLEDRLKAIEEKLSK